MEDNLDTKYKSRMKRKHRGQGDFDCWVSEKGIFESRIICAATKLGE